MKEYVNIVTSCTNGRDKLIESQNQDGARLVAYVDDFRDNSVWEQRQASNLFKSPRRNSRIHKILIHQFVDSEYSLWMDANMSLLVPASKLIDEWLQGYDVAIFRHRLRNCIYQEADICARLGLDDPYLIDAQVRHYRKNGFLENQGLAEACIILRRHNSVVEKFNNAWWSEYCRWSVRDQISLMVAAKESGVSLRMVEPTRFDNPYFHSDPRPPGIEVSVKLPANVMEIC